MKTISRLLLISLLSLAVFSSHAQVDDIPDVPVEIDSILAKLPPVFSEDNTLKLIARFLPEQWKVEHRNDSLMFIYPESVYEMTEDLITDSIKRNKSRMSEVPPMKAETSMLIFHMEPVWSGDKVNEVNSSNSFIMSQIEKLPERFKIIHLIDTIHSDSFNLDSADISENDKKSIIRYFEEKEKLENDLIVLPDFHSALYSYFLIAFYPEPEKTYRYTPPHAMKELHGILELFNKHAGK